MIEGECEKPADAYSQATHDSMEDRMKLLHQTAAIGTKKPMPKTRHSGGNVQMQAPRAMRGQGQVMRGTQVRYLQEACDVRALRLTPRAVSAALPAS